MTYATGTLAEAARLEAAQTLAERAAEDGVYVDEMAAPIDRLAEDEPSAEDAAWNVTMGNTENATPCAWCLNPVSITDGDTAHCAFDGPMHADCQQSHRVGCSDCWQED